MDRREKMKKEMAYYGFFKREYYDVKSLPQMWDDFCENSTEWACDEADRRLFIQIIIDETPGTKEWLQDIAWNKYNAWY